MIIMKTSDLILKKGCSLTLFNLVINCYLLSTLMHYLATFTTQFRQWMSSHNTIQTMDDISQYNSDNGCHLTIQFRQWMSSHKTKELVGRPTLLLSG